MRIQKERRVQIVHDLPHWHDREDLDREALRRLAIKDRARSISSSQDTFVPQAVVVSENK